jgi:hypothetical protein
MASTTASTSHIISNLHLGADADGVDFKVFGDTTSSYMLWDASANNLLFTGSAGLSYGTLSSTAQTGITLSSSNTSVLDVFADDNNVALTNAVYTNIRARTMLFKTPTEGSLYSVLGQIKCADEVDFNPGVFAGVRGYIETMDDTDIKSGAKMWAVDGCLDAALASYTVKSGGISAAFHAELTGAGTFTQDSGGILAGLYIDETATSGKWGYGIYMTAGSANKAIRVGSLSSTTAGSGMLIDATHTRAVEVHVDDNDTARAVGTQGRAIFGRTMIYANNACEDWGIDGLSKMSGVAKTGNVSAGVVGRFETTGTCSTATGSGNTFVAGVMGRLGLGSGFTIGASTYACGVLSFYNTAAASDPTGERTVAYMATASDIAGTGDWDYGVFLEDTAIGIYSSTTTQAHEMIVSALPANARGARYAFTCATPAMSDGYGAHEIDLTVGGTATGSVCASSTWINAGASATLASSAYAWVHNDGVWLDNSATATGACIVWSRVQFAFGTNTTYSTLHLFDLNLDIDQDMTSLINVNNLALTGFTAGAHASAVTGSIPFIGTGGSVKYIRVYDSAS